MDTGNWRTDSFNAGVEAGADQFVEKKEAKCLNESPEECNDLGLGAAQREFLSLWCFVFVPSFFGTIF